MSHVSARKKKAKQLKWSKIYSFRCFRPEVTEPPSVQQLSGPGFSRWVFCNESYLHGRRPFRYPNNSVSTTKYNFITFIPKALFEQFRRVANLYFLLVAVLSLTPLTPFSPVTAIAPLLFVVGISMAKEAVEDWHRFVQDIKVNSRTVRVHVGGGNFVEKQWKEVLVGDIVRVEKNQYFPSDLLLLSSSFDDGICYVETMNLDGETNLKLKRCLEATQDVNLESKFDEFRGKIRCEDPNPNLYSFIGNLEYQGQVHPLTPIQVLLRDSKLRNTDCIYGAVIFTGHDTKAIQNSTRSPSKRSRIERKMDRIIYILFTLLALISLAGCIGSYIYIKFQMIDWWYLRPDEEDTTFNIKKPGLSGFLVFIRGLVLYGNLIPISLYVSIEVVKVLQAMLINRDILMYDEETDKSVEARTSNLNEELGQVEIILSDKTGTLTCNQMEFRKCSIAGTSYGGEINEVDIAVSRRMNLNLEKFRTASQRMDAELEKYRFGITGPGSLSKSFDMFEFSVADFSISNEIVSEDGVQEKLEIITEKSALLVSEHPIKGFNFKDDRLMNKNWVGDSKAMDIAMFFRVLALCHTGIPVEEDDAGKLKYEAESPEEVAFLIAAQEFGFKFCRRTQSTLILKEFNPVSGIEVERQYKLLNMLEFNSSRKRMSVIVSDENGQLFLLCKGADSVIFERLASEGRAHLGATTSHLSEYAEDGLRTLAIAYRKLEQVEYEKWNSIFNQAKTCIGSEREELLASACDMTERNLILLGAVAVEDKLQKGVPQCIDRLAQAGIKIWLLTGDKKETAINIGFSCSLLRHDMKQLHVSIGGGKPNCDQDLKEEILRQIEAGLHETILKSDEDAPFALIVDGGALEFALQNEVRSTFLRLAVTCASVICCRVSPKQKALITKLVKEHTKMTTLAIGDGANDVGMIQAADIGVGISGMEGMQAVMASDFSLPQFQYLERLLVVHGHWCYIRIAKMILYFVYKNVAFGMTLFFYDIYAKFSGELLYDDWYMVLFNVLLTSLPVIALGVLEQDVSAEVCLQFPALYQQGQKNIYFTWHRIIGWISNALYASIAVFFFITHAFIRSSFRSDGKVPDIEHLGTIMYTCIIMTVNCQILLISKHFTWMQPLFTVGSMLLWFLVSILYGSMPVDFSDGAFKLLSEELAPAQSVWLAILLVVIVSVLPYFSYSSAQRLFYPMDDHLIQEMMHCKSDEINNGVWHREQMRSRRTTQVGFSARVDARVKYWKQQLNQKKMALYKSVANSPLFR